MGQRNSWGSQRLLQKNIYNDPLEVCSLDPITGWYRDGYGTKKSELSPLPKTSNGITKGKPVPE